MRRKAASQQIEFYVNDQLEMTFKSSIKPSDVIYGCLDVYGQAICVTLVGTSKYTHHNDVTCSEALLKYMCMYYHYDVNNVVTLETLKKYLGARITNIHYYICQGSIIVYDATYM